MKKFNEVFLVSETFNETTPKSASQGDFSDNGFISKDTPYTLKEVLQLIESGQYIEWSSSDPQPNDYISTDYYISDYETGTERQESAHITGAVKNLNRLFKILKIKGLI